MRSRDRTTRLLRGIAGFEAFKGLVALAAALGLLGLAHQDLHQAAAALIGRVGLSPGGRYPAMALGTLDHWLAAGRGHLLLGMAGYVGLRFAEAYGLWQGRAWGEYVGAASGALYLPFELQHLIHRPSALTAAVLAANLAVVVFLVGRLRHRSSVPPPLAAAAP